MRASRGLSAFRFKPRRSGSTTASSYRDRCTAGCYIRSWLRSVIQTHTIALFAAHRFDTHSIL